MKWVLAIFILILFLYWWFSDNNFYTLNMYLGKMGCGKTTHIAKLSQKYIRKGYKVYCNFELPGTYLYNPRELNEKTFEPNSIVFLDEIGLIFNNRMYNAKNGHGWEYGYTEFFKFCRQFRVQLHCYSQHLDSDKVVRNLVHNLYIISRFGKISIIRPVYKTLTISTNSDGQGVIVDCYKWAWPFDWKFVYLPRYYGLFKTYNPPHRELINETLQQYNDINIVYQKFSTWALYKIKSTYKNIYNKVASTLRL